MITNQMTDTLEISPALAPRGLTLRHWRDNADYQNLSAVLIASRNADGLEEARSADILQTMYEHMGNFELTRDLFLVEHAAALVGYAGCRWSQDFQSEFIHMHWLFVLPAWRGIGIEKELLHHVQKRVQAQAQAHPAGATNWFDIFVADSQPWLIDLLVAEGYQPARYFYEMVCNELDNLPDTPLPAGIETRPATPDQFRQIWDAQTEAFAEHWGETIPTQADYERWLNHPLMKAELWQVAWEGDEIVGMVLNFINPEENKQYNFMRGYTENISVRKPWRKRGIARALLVKSMQMFRDMGCDHTMLEVDTDNATGALHVYESVGYKTHRRFMNYRRQF